MEFGLYHRRTAIFHVAEIGQVFNIFPCSSIIVSLKFNWAMRSSHLYNLIVKPQLPCGYLNSVSDHLKMLKENTI